MIDLAKIEEIIVDQKSNFIAKPLGLERDVEFSRYLRTKQIVVLSGVRRCGKSTLLRQFADKLDDYFYVNFDDERLLDFEVSDFNNLMLAWNKNGQTKNILIDEIQNITGWERFVRRVHDEGYKIFLTGSNSKLLSSELSTHLTGRYFKLELFPFSFKELLKFRAAKISHLTTEEKAGVLKIFDEYLKNGGFPEFIKEHDGEALKRTYEDIVYRDIISRFGIRDTKTFRLLSSYLFSNFTSEISYYRLAKTLEIKSQITVRKNIGYLEESYLVFELAKYDSSLRKQIISGKKIYTIDNGMRNQIAFYVSEDSGRLLENLVHLELRRRQKEFFYFQESKECDFVVREKNKIVQALQVAYGLDKINEEREIAGLLSALEKFNLSSGLILTYSRKEKIIRGNKIIQVMPAWEWLIETS